MSFYDRLFAVVVSTIYVFHFSLCKVCTCFCICKNKTDNTVRFITKACLRFLCGKYGRCGNNTRVNSKVIWISLCVRALKAITLISIRKERKRERWKKRTKIKNKTRRRQTQFGSGKFIVRKWNTRVRSGKCRWLYSSVRHYQDLAFRLLKCAAATRKYWQLKVLASLFQSWTRPGFTFESHYSRKFAFKSYRRAGGPVAATLFLFFFANRNRVIEDSRIVAWHERVFTRERSFAKPPHAWLLYASIWLRIFERSGDIEFDDLTVRIFS